MRLWVSTQTRRGKVIMSGPCSRLGPWWSDSFPISEAWFHMASFLHNGPSRPCVCAGTPLRLTPLNQTRPTDWTEEPRRSSAFVSARAPSPSPTAFHVEQQRHHLCSKKMAASGILKLHIRTNCGPWAQQRKGSRAVSISARQVTYQLLGGK